MRFGVGSETTFRARKIERYRPQIGEAQRSISVSLDRKKSSCPGLTCGISRRNLYECRRSTTCGQALEIATYAIDRHVNKDADAMAAVGQTLIRMGDSHRSMDYLSAALHSSGRSDASCADDLPG